MLDPYKTGKKSQGPYNSSTVAGQEVDLRAEMSEIFRSTEKGTWFLYRRARLDSKGLPTKHPDVFKNRNGEIPRDVPPIGATNNGNLFDDYMVLGFLNHSQAYSITNRQKEAGESTVDYRTAYFEYDFLSKATGDINAKPTRFDKLIQVHRDSEGNVESPLSVDRRYDVLSIDPYRLDSQGRIEYYRFRLISVVDESFQV